MEKTMSIKSKLVLVAALTTLIAAPAFAADQQASTEATDRAPAQVSIPSGAYASAQRVERGVRWERPAVEVQTQTGDFQSVGSH
jgi:hypothetical protein